MGCGCGSGKVTVRRVRSGGVAAGAPLSVGSMAPRVRGARIDGHCCEACAVGAPCGSHVGHEGRAAGYDWRAASASRAAGLPVQRAAGDPPSCVRRSGESVDAYRERCGLEPTGMDAELWASMSAAERRTYLQGISREAGQTAREEQRLIGSAISGGFNTLVEIIRAIRDVRMQEIRSGAAVQIASVRGLSESERQYLNDWGDGSGGGSGSGSGGGGSGGGSGGGGSGGGSSSGGTVATIGALAILAKLAGVW